jgi:hypothetical protein
MTVQGVSSALAAVDVCRGAPRNVGLGRPQRCQRHPLPVRVARTAGGAPGVAPHTLGEHNLARSGRRMLAPAAQAAPQTVQQCEWDADAKSCVAGGAVNIMYAVRGQPVSAYLW